MTFHGSEEIAVSVFRLGVRDYVRKPFSVNEMLEAIDRALMETRLRREKDELTQRLLKSNREMQRRIKELNALYSIGKSVTSLVNIRQLLTRVVDAAVYVTGADQASLMMLVDGALYTRAVRLKGDAGARPVNQLSNSAAAQRALKTGMPVAINPGGPGVISEKGSVSRAVLYTPLKLGDEVVGVLGVDNLEAQQPFTEHDSTLLGALGDYAAVAIQNAKLFAQLESVKEREKQAIRGAFERYVGPSVAGQVLQSPEESTRLGGKRQVISVLFADISGYTTFSEKLAPEDVVETLNEFFSMAGEIIMTRGGTLDKFMGDAVMAFFNAPKPQPNHVFLAVDAAVTLQRAVAERNVQSTGNAKALRFSIGLSVGEAVVGNIGTIQQMNYTAIGDTVNLAKRLQERASPGQVLVEERVVQALGDRIRVEPLGMTKLKGRQARVNVYDLKGLVAPRPQKRKADAPT
jgi:class 3 adenylate cyclase